MTDIPKFDAIGIGKVDDVGWQPKMFFISSTGSSVATGIIPAGPEKAIGVMTSACMKDPTDKQWANDPGYLAWIEKYYSGVDPNNVNNGFGYSNAQTLVQVLKQCGDIMSRKNIREHRKAGAEPEHGSTDGAARGSVAGVRNDNRRL
jgi:hypothetical protein